MFFFFSNWLELIEVPNLDKLVPNMSTLVEQLIEAEKIAISENLRPEIDYIEKIDEEEG